MKITAARVGGRRHSAFGWLSSGSGWRGGSSALSGGAEANAFARVIKSESSEWVHREIHIPLFQWQEGHGAFTVSPDAVEKVASYVGHQEEHHRAKTSQEEYVELLERAGIKYEEKYLW